MLSADMLGFGFLFFFFMSHYASNMKYLLSHANESYGEIEALLVITWKVEQSKIVQLTIESVPNSWPIFEAETIISL